MLKYFLLFEKSINKNKWFYRMDLANREIKEEISGEIGKSAGLAEAKMKF